jgi:hypothetical protein
VELHQQAARFMVVDEVEGLPFGKGVEAVEGELMPLRGGQRAEVVKGVVHGL